MNRTPEFPRKQSRTLKISIFSDIEDMKDPESLSASILKPSNLHSKAKPDPIKKGRSKNLEEMKKLGIELDKQIELKQKLIQNSLLSDKDLDQKIGSQIFSRLQLDVKTSNFPNISTSQKDLKDQSHADQVKDWVKQQKAIDLKSKMTSIPSKPQIKPLTEPKRAVTPIVQIKSSPLQSLPVIDEQVNTRKITRQISNTIKKARELRKLITRSTSPVPN